MLAQMNFVFGVEIKLLKRSLAVVIYAIDVVTSQGSELDLFQWLFKCDVFWIFEVAFQPKNLHR